MTIAMLYSVVLLYIGYNMGIIVVMLLSLILWIIHHKRTLNRLKHETEI